MKTIGTVLNLIEKAQARAEKAENKRGIASINKRQRHYNWGGAPIVGELQEVYCVEYLDGGLSGATVELWHYGTKTAEVWLADTPQVLHVYGESRSDADSVNTFLDYFGIETRYTYKPVNGGFQEVAQ